MQLGRVEVNERMLFPCVHNSILDCMAAIVYVHSHLFSSSRVLHPASARSHTQASLTRRTIKGSLRHDVVDVVTQETSYDAASRLMKRRHTDRQRYMQSPSSDRRVKLLPEVVPPCGPSYYCIVASAPTVAANSTF